LRRVFSRRGEGVETCPITKIFSGAEPQDPDSSSILPYPAAFVNINAENLCRPPVPLFKNLHSGAVDVILIYYKLKSGYRDRT
ncbi:MAG: hypothetical protein LUG92_05935, partial [Oscillospiraceae bacterium]|nr:hypothetical protein [Oscillospiraceae bacterium]